MVDLTNLKVGDTVHLRCGGSIVVPDGLIINKEIGLVDFDNHRWVFNGQYCGWEKSPFDIISVTPKPEPKRIKGWVNIYEGNMLGGLWDSKEDANAPQNLIRASVKRIACVYIDVAEGEGL